MKELNDNIVAISTSTSSPAALSIIRMSGKTVLQEIAFLLNKDILIQKSHTCKLYKLYTIDKSKVLDEVIITVFLEPNSFTSEDTVEITCHGGIVLTQKIYLEILKLNVRPATKGEFSLRAFINGKMTYLKAETINEMIMSSNEYELNLAQNKPHIDPYIEDIKTQLTTLSLNCSVSLDFLDVDEYQKYTYEELQVKLEEINKLIENQINTLKLKLTAIQGFKVVLIGETNSGKSSLFNLLINDNRAIISSTPGTTRDYLEKQISIQGIPINLYDTAGLRSTKSKIEKEGILKTYELIKQADLVILLRDNSIEYPKSIIKYLKDNNINYFKIANKSDLESTIPKEVNEISISTLNHTNIDEVIKKIQDLLNLKDFLGSNYSLNNHRQLNLLYSAKTKLLQIINDSNIYQDTGLLVDLLNQSISDICHIYGDNYEFEPIKEMFAKFCIGK